MNKILLRHVSVLALASSALVVAPSCTKDLDRTPTYDLSTATIYKDLAGYQAVAAKVYSGFAITGGQGPDATTGDIQGIDQGTSDYIRQLWSAQELTTDEAVIAWGDPGVQDWHNMNWTSSGVLVRGLYSRILYEVTLCNGFLAEATDSKLSDRGISGADAATVKAFRAEVRFLRALAYYHALDLYGNVPFSTETDQIGGITPPKQIKRADLFAYIESELKAIDADLVAPGQNLYGRADKAAAWALLARLYLNAEVYTGTARYADCSTYAKKVIDSGAYSLSPKYGNLFRTDNYTNKEIIFAIAYDGKRTQTYGGTTFLTHAAVSGTADANWNPARYGIGGGWGGIRTTTKLYEQFADTAADTRGKFVTGGQSRDIVSQTDFKYGYVPVKFKNVSSTGVAGTDPTFVDTDFPIFRLADVYLMYAEAALRGSGDRTLALNYVNLVRTRAFKNTAAGNITASDLTLDFLLNERSREMFWEATRRTDLIRYGRFTTAAYLWPWKGGVAAGVAVPDTRNLFPIPAADLSVNSNLVQNPGY
ncbi:MULTISPECIES: RagB/SusD family nutrient uptake outer membrane protein [Hymenobacter]|uniref:RagB/SusD family nutrient uptake outer membrane protein n=1 Tax=Hymenobacter jejuensis TaxID=2502781 RepID=A0A5B7ZVU3_9BACT|nr:MULTISPECIES: RagB/SusD family nutrient uptake outer membrane protein [Hymenobacter]MBC6989098.1 RagB/SusD family nutrient uptake outer membrane protein [Hymenobacter sp. BT491]QDA58695.1 RagB/SusD family nutrient uptake outer membrane protein [Hymenobacter jejuensis]